MLSLREAKSRRRFLQDTARLGAGICSSIFVARGREKADAFYSFPKSVWRNARLNGLIMIHRPAPALLAPRTQIVRVGEPGQPLIVQGQVFAPAYARSPPGFQGSTPASVNAGRLQVGKRAKGHPRFGPVSTHISRRGV